ncbi:DUF106 domain-containing protein [Candidatus Pacearchaeota archaeon]|nr:DUF106 domain-containing protein [Candidatus Pacearchaeota archaeon]
MITEFVHTNPLVSILLISLLVNIVFTFIYKRFTNQTKLKEIKEKQKEYQKQIKELKDKPQQMMQVQKEMMQMSGEQMKLGLKPMLLTFIPFILVLGGLRNLFNTTGNMVIEWGKNIPIFHTGFGWVEWYIFSSIIFSMLLRKWLKVY